MIKSVIYGGTFNPIHDGHLGLCRYVLETGGFDRILLFPAAAPPHKDAPELIAAQHRLAMCRLAVSTLPQVQVEDWELKQGGKSYTVDTVNYLRECFPQEQFYLLMGSDMFLTFTQWRDWQTIGKETILLVASREEDDKSALYGECKHLESLGIRSQIINNPVVTVSSTQIRRNIAEYGDFSQLPKVVADYMKVHHLYSKKYDLTILRTTVQPLQTPERYNHTLCVERQAVHLAERYGGDINKSAAAAILHDVCKNMPTDVLLQMIKSCDTIYCIDFQKNPQLLHSYAGAVYIAGTLGIADDDIQNAVRYHTTARAGMSLLEKIIYIADLTSAERNYPDAEKLRNLADRSLDKAMLYSLEYITQNPKTRGKDTMEALEEYRSLDK